MQWNVEFWNIETSSVDKNSKKKEENEHSPVGWYVVCVVPMLPGRIASYLNYQRW